MITGRLIRRGEEAQTVDLELVDTVVPDGQDGWVWYDVVDPTVVDLASLQRCLGLHPLAIEDARHRGQVPKAEVYGDHVFAVMRPLSVAPDGMLRETEVHAFASAKFLLTLRFTPVFDLKPVTERWKRQPDLANLGTPFALYALLDAVSDGYVDVVEQLEDNADKLEDHVFGAGWGVEEDAQIQASLLRLRRGVVIVRRRAAPMRQALDLLESQAFVTSELAPYYRDVMDHLLRVAEMVDGIRDLITTLLDVRAAQAANRLNEVMKKLTGWAGIILVPTLIAGIYGMNFEGMPELRWELGYPLALGMMGAASFALYLVFKRKGWL